MEDVMIDFETLGHRYDAVIIQIAGAYFSRSTGEVSKTFIRNVNASSELRNGFKVDGSTIYWWLSQSDEARKSIERTNAVDSLTAMTDFNEFLRDAKYIWSHATFDFVILMNHLDRLNIKASFTYRKARDIRTLLDVTHISNRIKRDGVHHNALDDCLHQIKYCIGGFR